MTDNPIIVLYQRPGHCSTTEKNRELGPGDRPWWGTVFLCPLAALNLLWYDISLAIWLEGIQGSYSWAGLLGKVSDVPLHLWRPLPFMWPGHMWKRAPKNERLISKAPVTTYVVFLSYLPRPVWDDRCCSTTVYHWRGYWKKYLLRNNTIDVDSSCVCNAFLWYEVSELHGNLD